MRGLIDYLGAEDVTWDVVTGISAGGLNAAQVFTTKIGTEHDMSNEMLALWRTNPEIMRNWPEGMAVGLLTRPSLWDNTPLRELVQDVLRDKPIHRRFAVSATDANRAEFVTFTETMPIDDIGRLSSGRLRCLVCSHRWYTTT